MPSMCSPAEPRVTSHWHTRTHHVVSHSAQPSWSTQRPPSSCITRSSTSSCRRDGHRRITARYVCMHLWVWILPPGFHRRAIPSLPLMAFATAYPHRMQHLQHSETLRANLCFPKCSIITSTFTGTPCCCTWTGPRSYVLHAMLTKKQSYQMGIVW